MTNQDLEGLLNKIADPSLRAEVANTIASLETELQVYKRESRIDHLTGLPNLRGFEEELQKAIRRVQREHEGVHSSFSFAYADIVDLRGYNKVDFSVGNRAIKTVASLLSEITARPDDAVGRTGGDEFGLIISDLKEEDHPIYLQKFNERLSQAQQIIPGKPLIVYLGLEEYGSQPIEDLKREAYRKVNEQKRRLKADFNG